CGGGRGGVPVTVDGAAGADLRPDSGNDRSDGADAAADGADAASDRGDDAGDRRDVAPERSKPACGDGVLDGVDECDDGNLNSGDGCSPSCQIEANWVCTISACIYTAKCGDGVLT